MSILPSFLRRRVLLGRARELLAAGDARAALAVLSDPIFDGSTAARELLSQAEARLESEVHPTGAQSAIKDLLARMRSERAARSPDGPTSNTQAMSGGARLGGEAESAHTLLQRALVFRLAVDDAGEFLTVAGKSFTIGHLGSTRADLRFLAQVESEHARVVLSSGFHSGPVWRIVPIGSARVVIAGREVKPEGRTLCDGDDVVLGQNLALRFSAAEIASSSAVMALDHGLECAGATRILLFAPGPDGRVRIGSQSARPIRVPETEHDVTLELVEQTAEQGCMRLSVGCVGGVERGTRPSETSPTALTILVPPTKSERFSLGARARGLAPFEIVLLPLDEARGEPG